MNCSYEEGFKKPTNKKTFQFLPLHCIAYFVQYTSPHHHQSLCARWHLMRASSFRDGGYLDDFYVISGIVWMCIFPRQAYCIFVVFLLIGKRRDFFLTLERGIFCYISISWSFEWAKNKLFICFINIWQQFRIRIDKLSVRRLNLLYLEIKLNLTSTSLKTLWCPFARKTINSIRQRIP